MWSFVNNKEIRSGYGWRKTGTLVRLSVFISAVETKSAQRNSGILCCLFTVSVQSATLISGKRILLFFHRKDIERHRTVGKETGQASYIERFNNTLQQRVSRLVKKILSFSKKIENHIGAIWYFIHHYNASLA